MSAGPTISGVAELRARLASFAASLGDTWTAAVTLPTEPRQPYPTLRERTRPLKTQSTNADVLRVYDGTPRDVFRLSDADREAIVRDALAAAGDGFVDNPGAHMMRIAGAWRRRVVAKLRGAELPAPSARWTERKGRLGLSTLAMNASGQLARALERSQLTIHRRR